MTATTSSVPSWTSSLRNLLIGFADQAPRSLLPALEAFSGVSVSPEEFVQFVETAPVNSKALIALRLALAKWDAAEYLWPPTDGNSSSPAGTLERRQEVIAALGFPAPLEEAIRAVIPIHQSHSVVISRDFEPWYEEAKTQRSALYWTDYRQYLAEVREWPANSIAALDRSTDSVIERLADPTRASVKQTKGLVVGYVQSGKTANFTGVAAKAIDAGYRLIVIMTGTIEILRAQTQRRIDMELMGVENVLAGQDPSDPQVAKELDYQNDEAWLAGTFVVHTDAALDQPGVARIRRVTTHHSDYKRLPQGIAQLRFEKRAKAKPLNAPENLFDTDAYVVVIKKNGAPLRKLIQDLKPLRDSLKELPALIIDDESDLASVNVVDPKRSQERSKINKLITELMEILPRAQYVGYTATPFANVFIDPDDDSDLFPSDFVLSLPRPEGYMGVQEFHDIDTDWEVNERSIAVSNELAYVRSVSGDPDTTWDVYTSELREAMNAWVLSGAIKKYREAHSPVTYQHHTMLVHEQTGQKAHADSAQTLRELWASAQFTSGAGLLRLRSLFDSDFAPVMAARAAGVPVPRSFDELKPFIAIAFAEMTSAGGDPVLIVNSDKSIQDQQQELNFDTGKVWRILVGGTKLSRGFTVEGLTTSYFRRKSGQADTLMQAGRWFGFRPGYEDLVRLYIRRDSTVDLYEAFEALLLDEEAFRQELSRYEGFDEDGRPLIEPRQIPPLVSQHLPWLKPTARNKMFNAVIAARISSGTFHQLSSIPARAERAQNKANLETAIIPMLAYADTEVSLPYVDDNGVERAQSMLAGLAEASDFLSLFDKLVWHPDYSQVINPLRKSLKSLSDKGRIKDWAVLWPQHKGAGRTLTIDPLTHPAPIWKRSRRPEPRIDFTGENKRNLRAAEPVAQGKLVTPFGESPTRGVVVVSLVADRPNDSEEAPVTLNEVVGLLSLRIPDHSVSKRDLIQYVARAPHQPDVVAVPIPQR